MPDYHVIWEIDVTADDPVAAARLAREHQIRPGTTATVFQVSSEDIEPTDVDLSEIDEEAPLVSARPASEIDEKYRAGREAGETVRQWLAGADMVKPDSVDLSDADFARGYHDAFEAA